MRFNTSDLELAHAPEAPKGTGEEKLAGTGSVENFGEMGMPGQSQMRLVEIDEFVGGPLPANELRVKIQQRISSTISIY